MSFEFLRSNVELRALTDVDAPQVGGIIYRAIARVFRDHGQPEPVADAEEGERIARLYLELDPGDAMVAIRDGKVAAAGFLHIRDQVASLGPVVVEPDVQGQGLGKLLVDKLSERAAPRCPTIRLFVDTFNTRAFGIALKRGFLPRDTGIRLVALGGLSGRGMLQTLAPAPVRDLTPADLEAVAGYDREFYGGSRERDFRALIARGATGLLAEEGGTVRGYLIGRVDGSLATIGPGSADSADLFGKLLARLGERLAPHATIFLAHLYASQADVVQQALSMGFRASSLSIAMARGDFTPVTRASAIALPPDVA